MQNGRLSKRLLVLMPPRHGKSELISHFFPAWFLGLFPDRDIILASHGDDFAKSWGGKARDVLEEYGPALFGVTVADDTSAKNRWRMSRTNGKPTRGGMRTAGVGGSITGHGADGLIIDDSIKNWEQARSQLQRDGQWDWFRSTAYTRLEPNAWVVVVMTAWHYDDLQGRIQGHGDHLPKEQAADWCLLHLAAESEGPAGDALGRAPGAPLWPVRFDLDALADRRAVLGSYLYTAMYQGRPSPEAGQILKREWWQYYTPGTEPGVQLSYNYIDTANKVGEENDWTAIQHWGVTANGRYLLDLWKGRLEFPDLVRKVQLWNDAHPAMWVIEDAASGTQLIQTIAKQTKIKYTAFKVASDKVVRATKASPHVEGHRVFLPEGNPAVDDFVEETAVFPNGPFDDQVDTFSMAMAHLDEKPDRIEQVVMPDEREDATTLAGRITERRF